MGEMEEAEQPTYRFKWGNVGLAEMVAQRRAVAQRLRREADILLKRAEQIEEEAHEWRAALELVEPEEDAP